MALKDIFCQDRAVGALQRAVGAGRVPHAYIFAGTEGVGKFTTAKAFAKLLLCKRPTAVKSAEYGKFHDSCGECESCAAVEAGSHPDLKLIYKELLPFTEEGKNKKPGIDMPIAVIREFVIDKAHIRPSLSDKTVFIIEEAHKLNNSSQNALLKVLEEPPAFCTIILLATRLEKLLPTTQSRCQVLLFGPIDEEIIVKSLTDEQISTTEARYWARFSQGSLGVARAWSKLRTESLSAYDIKRELLERIVRYGIADTVELEEWMSAQAGILTEAWQNLEKDTSKADLTRRAIKGMIQMIISALNDAMKMGVGIKELINSDQESQIRVLAGKIDAENAAQRIAKAYKSIEWVDASVNEKLVVDDLLLNLA